MLTVERIGEIAAFERLAGEWQELLQSSRTDRLFLTWEWLFTWWKHLAGNRELYLLTVRRGHELVGIAPLALRPWRLERLLPFRALEFMAADTVGSDYLDIIVRRGWERDVPAALAEYLAGHGRVLELARVDAASSGISALAENLWRNGWSRSQTTAGICPYIDLSGHDWESYLAGVGTAHRHNLRRRFRKLEKSFAVEFERAASEPRRRDCFNTLVDLHYKRWGGRHGSDALNSDALVRFHDELSGIALLRGWLRLFVLRLDGRPAAALYGFNYNGVFYFYQAGYDPAFRKHSVGLVTLGHTIRSAMAEGAGGYDLLHGDEQYKFLWTRRFHRLSRFDLFPPRVGGRLCRQVMNLRHGIRKALLPRILS